MTEQRDERTAVKTYVPAYQKEEWHEHADELDMALSEFVRSMVQAGRRGFETSVGSDPDDSPEEPAPPESTPGGDALETVVLEAVREQPREFDELVDVVAEDLRHDLDATLAELEGRNLVEHDRLDGGYAVVDDE